jgi:hypothetical protein
MTSCGIPEFHYNCAEIVPLLRRAVFLLTSALVAIFMASSRIMFAQILHTAHRIRAWKRRPDAPIVEISLSSSENRNRSFTAEEVETMKAFLPGDGSGGELSRGDGDGRMGAGHGLIGGQDPGVGDAGHARTGAQQSGFRASLGGKRSISCGSETRVLRKLASRP